MKNIQVFTFAHLDTISIQNEAEIQIREGTSLLEPVSIIERLDSGEYSIFTWLSSILLSLYLTTIQDKLCGKIVLEIGAGTALPSMVCAKLGARRVFATDRAEEEELLLNIRDTARLNQVNEVVTVLPYSWENEFNNPVDFILGADVFYSSEDFNDILSSIRYIIDQSKRRGLNPQFITAYQHRSSNRSIFAHLERYLLHAEVIPKDFLHSSHITGEIQFYDSGTGSLNYQKLEGFDEIVLIKISAD